MFRHGDSIGDNDNGDEEDPDPKDTLQLESEVRMKRRNFSCCFRVALEGGAIRPVPLIYSALFR